MLGARHLTSRLTRKLTAAPRAQNPRVRTPRHPGAPRTWRGLRRRGGPEPTDLTVIRCGHSPPAPRTRLLTAGLVPVGPARILVPTALVLSVRLVHWSSTRRPMSIVDIRTRAEDVDERDLKGDESTRGQQRQRGASAARTRRPFPTLARKLASACRAENTRGQNPLDRAVCVGERSRGVSVKRNRLTYGQGCGHSPPTHEARLTAVLVPVGPARIPVPARPPAALVRARVSLARRQVGVYGLRVPGAASTMPKG